MGRDVDRIQYCSADFAKFQNELTTQLSQLKEIITGENFGHGELMMGAELEMYLVDEHGEVSCINKELIDALNDDQYQVELNQYNLELNLNTVPQKGRPFSALVNEMQAKLEILKKLAEKHQTSILPIGILPTLRSKHLVEDYMTDIPRYHCLSDHIYHERGKAFEININGKEPLRVCFTDICAEGANTSFQVHLMIKPENFVNTFNAAQLTLPIVTALSGNSPIFLGKQLWDETRIALFKQSIDMRGDNGDKWQEPARVNFGFGWLRESPWELFAEAVAIYPPILPCFMEDKKNEKLPPLSELSLHVGTIWPWNRPVYSHHGNGHIRLEFRAIPAGPTFDDMAANAALAIGLATGFAEKVNNYLPFLPFRFAEYNFYRAAQHGLNAELLWPRAGDHLVKEVSIKDIIKDALPVAELGLQSIGVEQSEIDYYLGIIKQRFITGKTGAVWQKETLSAIEQTTDKDSACQKLVQLYLQHHNSGKPVATWPNFRK